MRARGLPDPSATLPEADFLFTELSGYLKPEDISELQNAYLFSQSAHSGQFRKSGEPYISHPLAVAGILGRLRLDPQTLTAALLHDVMEDTHVSKAEINDRFGKAVADLVDGVSKLDKIEFQTHADAQAENFRKMLLAMARDVRVILIKLADRLHNMRTLEAMRPEKRRRIARETMEIYAPIANRLGLNSIYQELQELSFRYLFPTRYRVLTNATKAARGNRREVVTKILDSIKQRLQAAGLDAEVTGREKQLYSIYKKMAEKHLTFSEVLDIYGFRVIVKDVPSCYIALGALHSLYNPIPGKFKDYIAIPKANGYQSLHNTLWGPYGTPIEVQIRTADMHRIAEAGVASHWLYKSTDADLNDLHMKTHQWLQSLLETLSDSTDSLEFLEHLKVDLFPGEVYVFTPQGKILALPKDATAVDFAYAVHTDIGDCCVAAKINGENAPLRTPLRSGDRVEIVTASHAKPNPAWLNYVVTGKARSHIRRFLKTMQYEESAKLGERLLHQALMSLKIDPQTINEAQWEKLARESGAKSKKDLLADMGLGMHLPAVIARRLASPGESASGANGGNGVITILGTEGMAVQFAKCCRPIPGDSIVGFIKKDQGLVIHIHDCPAISKNRGNSEHWLDVAWGKGIARHFEVSIKTMVANQRGVLARVAAAIAEAGSNIDNVAMEGDGAYTTMNFMLQIRNRYHLAQVMRSLRRIPEVAKITRMKG
ncbi:bifunctional (p)ppGpp synthetase/guanosine-3',5'-bis(diphosphate) 3'-pyrophosphohydrolase [Nitrosospira sp. NpAV]|uniref:RelA/SpoT family protein n=1 Tax=Nitrosospira sp. NpAV TaxID=58133 RepID=UPI0005A19106|nr:bifunctional (p)ppGpp synthetase/guanosine-3',5'-bis(diphosphate) 3'-pyrophosphohydrolase [Nitrosospira sp. NpAV]KIO49565.1 guanosine-3',5'-bis(diphosphate) 3'-pyrophosphohydrolase [Nitrosospira sp. NpAV]